jgi:poly-gamma-glutamate capsule biosynthesis protein CapA/YwtB (metallophosphatase superfamily)
VLASGCAWRRAAAEPPTFVTVRVVDETGAPVPDAAFVGTDGVAVGLANAIPLSHDDAGLVVAEGYLDEPTILDPDVAEVTVRLWRRTGSDGTARVAMQFGGDVMLGRRYQEPAIGSDTARARSAAEARSVVRGIGPIMRAADATFVNLETVVGDLPSDAAFDGKRFLLQSPSLVLAALDEMGVDLAALGNNHAYDWKDEGVASTLAALDGAGIAHAGAGLDAQTARAGRIIDVAGVSVATLSYTSVNGDFVNDQLPTRDDPVPGDLDPSEAWQYQPRTFGFGRVGDELFMERAPRRIGDAWRAFEAIEARVGDERVAALWRALTAPDAYPELQDWVARRGHGGAAALRRDELAADVAAQRAAGAAVVVVQIHGGFQFSEVAGEALRDSAHAAIDAGADLVVAHHPHVLQGFEWYRGRLIAHSLGNLLFDQDFLATFPSVILRTVWEGDRMLEARVVPLTIDRYRPVAVAGSARVDVLRMLDARSALTASSARVEPLVVGSVIDPAVTADATVRLDGTTGVIGRGRTEATLTGALDADGRLELPPCSVVRTADVPVELGVDLFRWGSIDDHTADGFDDPGTQWSLGRGVRADGNRDAHLRMQGSADAGRRMRSVARLGTPAHRWYDSDGAPIDSLPSYTLSVQIRRAGTASPEFHVDRYLGEDADPTSDPSSTVLSEGKVTLPIGEIGDWEHVELDVSGLVNAPDADTWATAIMPSFVLPPGSSSVDLDDVRVLEWRPMPAVAGLWAPADVVRGEPGTPVRLTISTCR